MLKLFKERATKTTETGSIKIYIAKIDLRRR